MAAGDLYSLRFQYESLGVQMENTFHYLQQTGSGDFETLGDEWIIDYVPLFEAVMHNSVDLNRLVIVNLDDSTDFGEVPIGSSGARPGASSAPYQAWGYIRFTTDRKIRTGGFRVGGIDEADVTAGVAEAAALVRNDALASQLESTLENASFTERWNMRLFTAGNPSTSGQRFDVEIDSIEYRRVTTQNSRKFPE
jgi:hypothetical protein